WAFSLFTPRERYYVAQMVVAVERGEETEVAVDGEVEGQFLSEREDWVAWERRFWASWEAYGLPSGGMDDE
ncbi:MAG TPA: hypothetical protein VLL52_22925, partial [Anaerolineae bacterium]|nr:hypothetical protein [Anaerolineae bacterium]